MITSIQRWKTKDDIQWILDNKPKDILIDGIYISDSSTYSGLPSSMRYGDRVVVRHEKSRYMFSKRTDGGVTVYE